MKMKRFNAGNTGFSKNRGIALVDVIAGLAIVATMTTDAAERSKVSERSDMAGAYVQDINNLITGCRNYASAQSTGFQACTTFANVSASPHLSDTYGDGSASSPEGTAFTYTGSTRAQLQVNVTFNDAAICEYNEGVWTQAGYTATCTGTAFVLTSTS